MHVFVHIGIYLEHLWLCVCKKIYINQEFHIVGAIMIFPVWIESRYVNVIFTLHLLYRIDRRFVKKSIATEFKCQAFVFVVTVWGVQIQILHMFESATIHLLFVFAFFKFVLLFFLYS